MPKDPVQEIFLRPDLIAMRAVEMARGPQNDAQVERHGIEVKPPEAQLARFKRRLENRARL